jgi:predicted transcriptional regulator
VGKTTKHQQLLLLDPEKAALLDGLAKTTRIAKQVLLREAIDDLLVKHKVLKVPKRKP